MSGAEAVREQLVADARAFLREVDSGERPDANPEVVKQARIIEAHAGRLPGTFPPEVRDAVRKVRRITMGDEEGDPEPYIERVREIQGGTARAVDDAASVLAEFAEAE